MDEVFEIGLIGYPVSHSASPQIFGEIFKNNHITNGSYHLYPIENLENIISFVIGNVLAFVVAAFAINFFIGFLAKYGFKIWGWYRILVGALLLIYFSN